MSGTESTASAAEAHAGVSGTGGGNQRPGRESLSTRLYSGTGAFDIIGRRRSWYAATLMLFLICVGSMVFRGFNLGIDFEGGTRLQLPATGANGQITAEQVEGVFTGALGRPPDTVQVVGRGDSASILVRTETLDPAQTFAVKDALFEQLQPLGNDGTPSEQAVSDSAVSATWGGEITQQALVALIVFLVLVSVFLAVYFEFRMAVAALVALVHDVVVTAGIYSMTGFEVTPGTVIGLLTILGFSLYDTVVVFDKVQENTRGLLGLSRRTYPEAANLAVNQTLMRSINTSFIAVLPVLGLLVIGVGLLGVGTLRDLALVQLVGIIAGVFSSIFIATPILVDLTMRRPAHRQQAARVAQRRANLARKAADVGSAGSGSAGSDSAGSGSAGSDSAGSDSAGDPAARDEPVEAGASRPERAPAGTSSVPARPGKSAPAPRGQAARARHGGRPSGKAGRPSGKKRH